MQLCLPDYLFYSYYTTPALGSTQSVQLPPLLVPIVSSCRFSIISIKLQVFLIHQRSTTFLPYQQKLRFLQSNTITYVHALMSQIQISNFIACCYIASLRDRLLSATEECQLLNYLFWLYSIIDYSNIKNSALLLVTEEQQQNEIPIFRLVTC